MSFRLFLLMTLLAALLGACVTTTDGDDLERMQRNQNAARETTA